MVEVGQRRRIKTGPVDQLSLRELRWQTPLSPFVRSLNH
jgi:hypothetical protein